MNASILFFELVLNMETEKFDEQVHRAYQRAAKKDYRMYATDFGHADESLMSHGIGIAYHDDSKKKKVRFVVYSNMVVGDDLDELWEPTSDNIMRLLDNLSKLIRTYFRSNYDLSDFKLARVDFAADIDVGSRGKVLEYIKVLHNIGRVKCFSPLKYGQHDGETKDRCFGLVGNSNGVEFRVHDLKHDKGVLRAEVRLTKKATIQAYSDESDTSDQLRALAERSEAILMDSFRYIIPRGDYYKRDKAAQLVIERVSDMKLRRRMLRLLTLIKEQKSIHLALKVLNYRGFKEILAAFADINLSPVTISKRHDVKTLPSLYSYL